jgi:putative ATP-dependent endonuclease of the OLD family
MRIERSGAEPVCRMRLEARWEDDGTVEGEVSQELFWADTLDPVIEDEQKHAVAAADRGLIQLYYTPASRDAESQIRALTRLQVVQLALGVQFVAASVVRRISGTDLAADMEAANHPNSRPSFFSSKA